MNKETKIAELGKGIALSKPSSGLLLFQSKTSTADKSFPSYALLNTAEILPSVEGKGIISLRI